MLPSTPSTPSTLKKMYDTYSESMPLPPLDEIRTIISRFYEKKNKRTKKPTFIALSDLIPLRFVKKMLYASEFMWPTLSGFCGILLLSFHLIKGDIRGFTIGSFHCDPLFMLLVSLCLFFSSYPFLVKSFDCNMQEHLPASPYFLRMITLSVIFIITSLLSVSVFYFSGLIKIDFY